MGLQRKAVSAGCTSQASALTGNALYFTAKIVSFPRKARVLAYYTNNMKLKFYKKSANFLKEITLMFSHFLHFWFWSHNQAIADCFYDSNNCTVLLNLNLILEIGLVGKV